MSEVMTYQSELETDLDLLYLVDSYTAERASQTQYAQENSGVEAQRLALWRLGAVALTTDEALLLQFAQSTRNCQLTEQL